MGLTVARKSKRTDCAIESQASSSVKTAAVAGKSLFAHAGAGVGAAPHSARGGL